MTRALAPLVVVALFMSACQGGDDGTPAVLAAGDTVNVVGIVKGDELEVEKGGKRARVRLLGIHAFSAVVNEPQIQALSAGGVSALEERVKGKAVSLTFDTPMQDPAGRYLAYVELDGNDINAKLVEEGWAVVYTEFPFAREAKYLGLEAPARQSGRNIWGLKPAAELVRGLRKQWSSGRSGDKPADSLLDG